VPIPSSSILGDLTEGVAVEGDLEQLAITGVRIETLVCEKDARFL
jgi:hypothetical protein